MWEHGKDMIIQVDDEYLLWLIHYGYDMLIPQIKCLMKGNSHPKPKEHIIMFIQGVNLQ